MRYSGCYVHQLICYSVTELDTAFNKAKSNVKISFGLTPDCVLIIYTGVNFIQNHPPPGTRLEGNKNPPSGTIIVYKTPPLGTKQVVKAPPLGHKVRKFHECIYKFWHYLKWKALCSQQIKRFFNEETDSYSIYHLAVTRVKLLNV